MLLEFTRNKKYIVQNFLLIIMKRLFIIRTPLQLFNAIEAKNRFFDASIKNELLVVYGSEKDLIIIKKRLCCTKI